MTTAALIVAAGRGTRSGSSIPKQYVAVGGTPMLVVTLGRFLDHARIDMVMVAIGDRDRPFYDEVVDQTQSKLLAPVIGADTRQGSVLNGLRALVPYAPDRVVIHDAARPFVGADIISRTLDALEDAPAAIAAVPVADTVKQASAAGRVIGTVPRQGLWRAQTPQAFRFKAILAAHEAAAVARSDLTDDAMVAELAGLDVTIVEGSEANRKMTTAKDLAMVAQTDLATPDIRTGQGFDVHRLCEGNHVWLCGIQVAHTHGLDGHSDADVGLHALTDALLGAIADGDIGEHFRNTDPRWKRAASHLFLADAAARVRARGGRIGNVDVTLICEAPKIGPHRDAMRSRIAEILEIDAGRVAVKATTSEGLGFTGRREGIAALATATVILR